MIRLIYFKETDHLCIPPNDFSSVPHYERISEIRPLNDKNTLKVVGLMIAWIEEIYTKSTNQLFFKYGYRTDYLIDNPSIVTESEIWKPITESYEEFKNGFDQFVKSKGQAFIAPSLSQYGIIPKDVLLLLQG